MEKMLEKNIKCDNSVTRGEIKWLTDNVMYLNEAINIINFVSDVLIWQLSHGSLRVIL